MTAKIFVSESKVIGCKPRIVQYMLFAAWVVLKYKSKYKKVGVLQIYVDYEV